MAERARKLVPQKFVSQNDLDNAVAAERSAGAAVEAARASVRNAQIDLGYAKVSSPIAGRAGKQRVTEGALVGQGEATLLTTVDQIDPLYVNFSMTADELAALRAAQDKGAVALAGDGKTTVQVNLPDGSAYAHEGTLDFSATTVDPATGAVAMRALVPNPGSTLFPGSFVTLRAKLGELSGAFLVPQLAVQRDANSAFVMLVGADGMVQRRNITTSAAQGDQWIVTAGLADGDKVIVSGLQKVREGAPATPTPWQPGGSQPAQAPASAPAPAQADAEAEAGKTE